MHQPPFVEGRIKDSAAIWITTRSAAKFLVISSAILNDVICFLKLIDIADCHINFGVPNPDPVHRTGTWTVINKLQPYNMPILTLLAKRLINT